MNGCFATTVGQRAGRSLAIFYHVLFDRRGVKMHLVQGSVELDGHLQADCKRHARRSFIVVASVKPSVKQRRKAYGTNIKANTGPLLLFWVYFLGNNRSFLKCQKRKAGEY